MLVEAKKYRRYIDLTFGKGVKTLMLMVDGKVIGCPMSTKTMFARLNASDVDVYEDEASC